MKGIYSKPTLSFNGLVGLIESAGIDIKDAKKAKSCLRIVSYHRLLPYLESALRNHSAPNFDKAWEIYCFDRELRLLINDAIERIEIAFRTALSETMSYLYSPTWFLNEELFKDPDRYMGFIEKINLACQERHNSTVREYYDRYKSPKYPPSWIVFEFLSFGACVSGFSNIRHLKDRKAICRIFKEHPTTMQSWLYSIRYMRNLCAHHARVWNRWFVVSPALSFMLGDSFNKQNTCYAHLIILDKLLQTIYPEAHWKERLRFFLEKNKHLPIYEIGFLNDWENDFFWNYDDPKILRRNSKNLCEIV